MSVLSEEEQHMLDCVRNCKLGYSNRQLADLVERLAVRLEDAEDVIQRLAVSVEEAEAQLKAVLEEKLLLSRMHDKVEYNGFDIELRRPEQETDVEFSEGDTFEFHGVDGKAFKLDDTVFEAIEKDDALDCLRVATGGAYCFFKTPIDTVRVEVDPQVDDYYYFCGFQLVSVRDGHVWLKIGTDGTDTNNSDFVFTYSPKPK